MSFLNLGLDEVIPLPPPIPFVMLSVGGFLKLLDSSDLPVYGLVFVVAQDFLVSFVPLNCIPQSPYTFFEIINLQ